MTAEHPKVRFSDLWNSLLEYPRHELVLKLTILLLMLHGAGTGPLAFPMRIVAGLMLIGPGWHRLPHFWPLLFVLTLVSNLGDWFTMDNHRFLILYWALACTLAVVSKDTDRVLAWNGRVLLALTFLFASGWKLFGGDYIDGDFFYFAFLTDSRLVTIAGAATGLSDLQLAQNVELFSLARFFPLEDLNISLNTSELARQSGFAMSWMTLLFEASVAFAFLYALIRRTGPWVDWLLIFFCWSTYTLVPIRGFGLILTIMGLAQAPKEHSDARWGYLLTFILVQLSLAYVVGQVVRMAG